MFHMSKIVKVFKHKEISIVDIFKTIKVLSYTALVLTIIRATIRQYQEHLDEKKSRPRLISHKKNTMDLTAMRRSSSSLSTQYFENYNTSSRGTFGSFSYSPLNGWALKTVGYFKSLIGKVVKRKRLTISLKNTILWNPSKDIKSPNHAFNENTVLLLSRLAQAYEVHLITHTNSSAEKKQIRGLLRNAHITRSDYLKKDSMIDQVHDCTTEKEKMDIIERLKPSIHVEGGWEMEDGRSIISQILNGITSVNKLIWVVSNQKRKLVYQDEFHQQDGLEFTDHITHSSVAKELGF